MGNVTAACDGFKISRTTFYEWMKDKDFAKEVDLVHEGTKDNVETALLKNALEGHVTAQIFYLKTQAKERGYVERTEVDHTSKGEKIVYSTEEQLGMVDELRQKIESAKKEQEEEDDS